MIPLTTQHQKIVTLTSRAEDVRVEIQRPNGSWLDLTAYLGRNWGVGFTLTGDLDSAYGVEERGRRPREYSAALKRLEDGQRTRAKRRVLDVVDRCLMDLVSVYRDAIALSAGASGALVNEEIRADVATVARECSPERLLRMIDAVFTAREQMLEFNVPPQLALESMTLALRLTPERRVS